MKIAKFGYVPLSSVRTPPPANFIHHLTPRYYLIFGISTLAQAPGQWRELRRRSHDRFLILSVLPIRTSSWTFPGPSALGKSSKIRTLRSVRSFQRKHCAKQPCAEQSKSKQVVRSVCTHEKVSSALTSFAFLDGNYLLLTKRSRILQKLMESMRRV